jgi:ATP-binding cassette, subfamily B (MDR/TAP), member 1
VQETLDNIVAKKKVTTIIIAHRLSTIRNVDKIHVIASGRVAESGSHDELIRDQGYYYRLVERQVSPPDGAGRNTCSAATGCGDPPARVSAAVCTSPRKTAVDESASTLIEFKGVSFSYPTRPRKNIFDKFSLKIPKGQTIALVGPSVSISSLLLDSSGSTSGSLHYVDSQGSGKSTTVGLIERFYDPVDGTLEYMGHDIRTLNVSWYRDQIGYVGQEPVLMNESIARNIAYGYPGASQAEIEHAARQANCHDFISQFPDGYGTMVGERGAQLSGGQKQRVAIARALIKKPQVSNDL